MTDVFCWQDAGGLLNFMGSPSDHGIGFAHSVENVGCGDYYGS
jgi:hypothetical protein